MHSEDHITINNYQDLRRFGVNVLTGEACALGTRLLCDLSANGRLLVADYLGISCEGFRPNWNSMVGDDPAVACVLLTRDALNDIGLYALLTVARMDVVVQYVDKLRHRTGSVHGLRKSSPYYDGWLKQAEETPGSYLVFHTPLNTPSSRNTHAMTGRSL